MIKSSAKNIAAVSGDSRTIDVVVVLAAGLFFTNIVIGTDEQHEPILAYAAELEQCPTGCLYVD